jgi:hypothetical protein
MGDLLSLLRLLAALVAAGAIVYGIYRGLRWRFPRLGASRTRLLVALGTVAVSAAAVSLQGPGPAQCLQHENTVLLRGERAINFREAADRAAGPISPANLPKVREACAFLAAHCPLAGADDTRRAAEAASRPWRCSTCSSRTMRLPSRSRSTIPTSSPNT